MDKVTPITQSSLHISEDVVATIVNEAVRELGGIYKIENLPQRAKLLATPAGAKPVRITIADDVARIDVGVIVNLSYRLKEVCEQAQAAIKDAVQNMTGITVSKVNVSVLGVHMPEAAAPLDEA